MSVGIRIAVILLIQTLVLCGMVGKKQYTLNTGRQILLETEPVDPRSLFRGDYVRLDYLIDDLSVTELDGDDEFKRYDSVYVVLKQGDLFWQPRAVYRNYPQTAPDDVVIKGEVKYVNDRRWRYNREDDDEPATAINVRYGIENYFVPEGEGREIERHTQGEVNIRVAVDRFGNAGIKAVLINGEERYIESLWD